MIFLGAFLWSVKSGQLDDVVTPSLRILHESEQENNNPNLS